MINSVSLDKIRRSAVTKVAGLFVLAVLAAAFFVFPLSAFAALPKIQLVGVPMSCGFAVNVEVDTKEAPQFMLAPYLDHTKKVSDLNPSSFFDAILPNGQHVTGMYLNKQTHQAVVIINGKPQFVILTDGGNINSNNR